MRDQFFTPADIATQLVAPFRRKHEKCIADFAAGNGELLKAAIRKWPKAKIIASDIDDVKVRLLGREHPRWTIGKCNFLEAISRKRCAALSSAIGSVSLVLLNPPFSCRGSERHSVQVENADDILCSRAMAFILNALPFLSLDGRLAAILPISCLKSQKDSLAWELIRKQFAVRVRSSFDAWTFPECSAKTAIVTLQRSKEGTRINSRSSAAIRRARTIQVRLIRGATSIHAAMNGLSGSNWSLVHTNNLQKSKVSGPNLRLHSLHRHVTGPAVLLPRVGKPNIDKCAIYLRRQRVVLSDCVYALDCDSRADAEEVLSRLQKYWSKIVLPAYQGTCAPYMTVDQLRGILIRIGCQLTAIEAVGHQTP